MFDRLLNKTDLLSFENNGDIYRLIYNAYKVGSTTYKFTIIDTTVNQGMLKILRYAKKNII